MSNRWEFPNIFMQRHPIFYGEVANLLLTCYRLVVYVADLLATQRGSLREVSNLLRGSYGETGVMDFGLMPTINSKKYYRITTTNNALHSVKRISKK